MMQYQTFCYLQNHKTGCTFVEDFLRRFCCEDLLDHHKHAALEAPTSKFCFTNVRDPLALYRSLFTYGLDGKGAVFMRLQRMGHGQLYATGPGGFAAWLDFIIRPRHATLLAQAYTPEVARWVGFMTWRFLRLACAGFEQAAPGFQSADDLAAYIKQHYALGAVLHQERLRRGLKALVQGPLAHAFADPGAALAWLQDAPRVNASRTKLQPEPLDAALLARLARREQLLYRQFYPQALPSSITPAAVAAEGAL